MDTKIVVKQLNFVIIGLAVLCACIGAVCIGTGILGADESILYWILGVALGTAVSLVKLLMIERTVEKAVDMEPQNAKNYVNSRASFRFVLTIVIVVLAIKIPFFNILGVIVGLILTQPAVYIVNFINRNQKK